MPIHPAVDRTCTPRVPLDLARSWRLVSALSIATNDSWDGRADVTIVDLEDAVAPQNKAAARDIIVAVLERRAAWVRINDVRSSYWRDDIAAVTGLPGLAGVMIAKTESPADADAVAAALSKSVPLVALVETAIGVEAATEIANHRRVIRLALGTNDFSMDIESNASADALLYARSRLVVASRAAGLPGPIDGPTVVDDHQIVVQETEYARGIGMRGRLCLYGSHADAINRVLSPSPDDIADALAVIERLGTDGSNATKGSDLPRLRRAHRVLQLVRQYRTS